MDNNYKYSDILKDISYFEVSPYIEEKDRRALLLDHICKITKIPVEKLNSINFLDKPASRSHHSNYEGGLFDHSLNVIKKLCKLSDCLGLKWSRAESPIIVGLLHDVCKTITYDFKRDETPYFGHGTMSLMLIDDLDIKLNKDEKLCILHHMGAYEKDLWEEYSNAIKICENVLWAHCADMYATKIMEGTNNERI